MAKAQDVQWPPVNLVPLKQSLDQIAAAVAERPAYRSDDEQIWLTRFLVVRICGYLEQVSQEVARALIDRSSGGLVRTFALSWMDRSRNPSADNLLELVGRFDLGLSGELQQLLDADDQRLRRELSLLVDRRHKIAHGLNEGLGASKALRLKADAELIAEWLFAHLNPDPRAKIARKVVKR